MGAFSSMRENPFSSFCKTLAVRVFLVVSLVFGIGATPLFVHAQIGQQNTTAFAENAGLVSGDLLTIIGRIIYVLLSLLGVVFLLLMLYAGYLWMTAGGDEKKVAEAKNIIRNAIIGVVIIASAFAITNFVLGLFGDDGGNGGFITSSKPTNQVVSLRTSAGALGTIIESHIPARDAQDVTRDTPIIITFKEPIKPESFIEGWTETNNTLTGVNSANVKIYPNESGTSAALPSDKARVSFTEDRRTFIIHPVDYLGSSTKNMMYTVALTGGNKGIVKMDGSAAFDGFSKDGYEWSFEVSTKLDLIPPRVVDVVPVAGGTYARNIIIQINFDKPMDPSTVSGKTQSIEVLAAPTNGQNPTPVAGKFTVANDYHTVEFTSDESCGINTCGQEIFCLPSEAIVQVYLKTANIEKVGSPKAIFTKNGYDGVVSVTGNSLDGNADGAAQGPPGDNYTWIFSTSKDIHVEPPRIEETIPTSDPQTGGNSNVPLEAPIIAKFDTRLRALSLNSNNVKIVAHGKDETSPDTFWWTVGMKLLNDALQDYDYATETLPANKSAIVVDHRLFIPSPTSTAVDLKDLNFYDPYIYHGVQDVYQNCFNPTAKCGSLDYAEMRQQGPNCCNSKASNVDCKFLSP
jgi:hypothetical protein